MNRLGFVLGAIVILVSLATSPHASGATSVEGLPSLSPRLVKLGHDIEAGNSHALADFWLKMKDKAPLVEPIQGEPRRRIVTFVWRGDDRATSVALCGGLPSPNLAKPLAHLDKTDLWYLTETHPSEARFAYWFQTNLPETMPTGEIDQMNVLQRNEPRRDPLNSREFAGRSYVELPNAPPQPWIIRHPETPRGKQTQLKFKSRILNAEYPLTVYTPPGYEVNGRRCLLMIAFDGGFPMMEETLDNLGAAGKIPPLVVVGVNNINSKSRARDLIGSESFGCFLAGELVPWARKNYRVYGDASHTLVGGVSLGGFMAIYCGLKHSGVFGKVLAQSPTLVIAPGRQEPTPIWNEEVPGSLTRRFAASPRLPVEFYLEVGRYETFFSFSMLSEARRLRDVLEAKGYRIAYHENVGGHDEVCWRGSFADALMALTARQRP